MEAVAHTQKINEPEDTNNDMSLQTICGRSDFIECHVAVILWQTVLPLLLVIGVPGNILSLVVLSRRRMRSTTTSVYLRLLAIVNTTLLLVVEPRHLLYYYASVRLETLSNLLCKTYNFFNPTCIMVSWGILPFIALDRLVQVRYPVWARKHCTRKSAVIVFIVLTLVIVAFNFHTLLFFSIKEEAIAPNSTNVVIKCSASSGGYIAFREKIWPVLILSLTSVTPVVCVIVCNGLLLRQLIIRSRQNVTKMSLDSRQEKKQRNLKSVSMMLIVLCAVFVVSSVPQCTRLIIAPYIFNTGSPLNNARALLFHAVAQLIMYSNNSAGFLLYTFTGGVFRKELVLMFGIIRRPVLKRAQRSVYPMQTNFDKDSRTRASEANHVNKWLGETKSC